jgi:hypothetical protein
LKNLVALKRYLNQNAGAIYQQAYLMEQIEADSLYVVTGCIKTAGWGLAAYQDATPGQVLRLTQRFDGNPSSGKGRLYDWARGAGEAWLWPNTPGEANFNDEKAHTLFLRGFTLAFSSTFYTRLMSALQTTGMGLGEDRSYYPKTSEPSGHSRPASGGTEYNSAPNLSPTSYLNTSHQAGSSVQLSSFPDMSKVVRCQCSSINTLLESYLPSIADSCPPLQDNHTTITGACQYFETLTLCSNPIFSHYQFRLVQTVRYHTMMTGDAPSTSCPARLQIRGTVRE